MTLASGGNVTADVRTGEDGEIASLQYPDSAENSTSARRLKRLPNRIQNRQSEIFSDGRADPYALPDSSARSKNRRTAGPTSIVLGLPEAADR
jgi:hypothetical protein